MFNNLEKRFEDFLTAATFARQLDGEVVVPDGVELADYMLFDNTILEMKTITKDVEEILITKAHSLIDKNVVIYGHYQPAISAQSSGKKINDKIYNHGTRLIENLMRKAKSQIDSTKSYLGTDLHGGVILILNGSLTSIPWDGILNKISELFNRKDEIGNFKYQQVEKVILIQDIDGGERGIYILNNSTTIVNSVTDDSVERMLASWQRV